MPQWRHVVFLHIHDGWHVFADVALLLVEQKAKNSKNTPISTDRCKHLIAGIQHGSDLGPTLHLRV